MFMVLDINTDSCSVVVVSVNVLMVVIREMLRVPKTWVGRSACLHMIRKKRRRGRLRTWHIRGQYKLKELFVMLWLFSRACVEGHYTCAVDSQ